MFANSVWEADSFVEALETRADGTWASYTTAAIADTDSNVVLAERDLRQLHFEVDFDHY